MDENQTPSDLTAALDHARSLAHEQVAAAWQLHIDRVRDELEAGWRDRLDRIFEERFGDIESRVRDGFQQAVRSGLARCQTDLMSGLNQTARRLRGAESHDDWTRTLTEAAAPYCGRATVFSVSGKGLSIGDQPIIPLASAPAFSAAVESRDTVVAVGTPGELSQAVSTLLGDASTKKVYLFPVVVRQNVVAILYAEAAAEGVDVSALELLAFLAAASTGGSEASAGKTPAPQLVSILGASPASASPVWTELPRAQQEVHLRAQRFARTRVAEMLLHKVRQVHEGRRANDLYSALREEIDTGRETFRKEFIDTCPSMVDYFHLELQRTLAKDNALALGAGYPGPLPVGPVAR